MLTDNKTIFANNLQSTTNFSNSLIQQQHMQVKIIIITVKLAVLLQHCAPSPV